MTTRQCATCEHFFPTDGDENKGICKLNPPAPFPMQTMNAVQQPQLTVITLPVTVASTEYCGFWEVRGGEDDGENHPLEPIED